MLVPVKKCRNFRGSVFKEQPATRLASIFILKSVKVNGQINTRNKTGYKVTVLTHVQDLATPKEDEELKFSSPTLKSETETSLLSRAHRQIIVAAAVKAGAHASWADKLGTNTLTDADVFGVAVKYTVAVNK